MHITAGCWLSLGIHCASISCNHCSYTWSIPCRVQDPRSYKKQKWFYQLYNTRVSCNATVYVHFPFHHSIPVIRDAHYLATYKFLCSTKWLTAAVDLQDCNQIMETCKLLGVPLAPEKIVGPTCQLTFLGIEIDSESLQLRLPQDKLDKLKILINSWRNHKAVGTNIRSASIQWRLTF